MQKTRLCVGISPDGMNEHIGTVIIAPMTTQSHAYPTRVAVEFEGTAGWIVLDQIRTIDKKRTVRRLGMLEAGEIQKVKKVLMEMLVE